MTWPIETPPSWGEDGHGPRIYHGEPYGGLPGKGGEWVQGRIGLWDILTDGRHNGRAYGRVRPFHPLLYRMVRNYSPNGRGRTPNGLTARLFLTRDRPAHYGLWPEVEDVH